jgi:hypothetical protein
MEGVAAINLDPLNGAVIKMGCMFEHLSKRRVGAEFLEGGLALIQREQQHVTITGVMRLRGLLVVTIPSRSRDNEGNGLCGMHSRLFVTQVAISEPSAFKAPESKIVS